MKLKFILGFFAILTLFFIGSTPSYAADETITFDVYDENDQLVDVIEEPVVEISDSEEPIFSIMANSYYFTASFSSNIWIKNRANFRNPQNVDTSLSGRYPGPYGIRIYNSKNVYQGRIETRDAANWISFPVSQRAPRGDSYNFQLYNSGSGKIVVKEGYVYY
ncbi:hypothetical protein MKY91_19595 [Alkalicoccobacillus gibsonii]|uniref:Uncharacterized protein n=1 Tax=Alkalicoccobacillus gibsonii TaxID=79881 RepID=A0ABU9VNG0_9BACI